MFRHHFANIATIQPTNDLSVVKQAVFNIDIALAIIVFFIIAVYLWADRKDEKEINELLKKNGIDVKNTSH